MAAALSQSERPLLEAPEQLLALRRRHDVAALQQVGQNQSLLDGAGPDPDPAVHPHRQLAGEQLLQVGPEVAAGRQEPAESRARVSGTGTRMHSFLRLLSDPSEPGELPSDQAQRHLDEQPSGSEHAHPVGPARPVDADQLRFHVLIGYDQLGQQQIAHLAGEREEGSVHRTGSGSVCSCSNS